MLDTSNHFIYLIGELTGGAIGTWEATGGGMSLTGVRCCRLERRGRQAAVERCWRPLGTWETGAGERGHGRHERVAFRDAPARSPARCPARCLPIGMPSKTSVQHDSQHDAYRDAQPSKMH